MPSDSLLAPPAPPVMKLLLTPRETAEALGICEKSLYNLTRAGELPAVRIGRAVRYSVEDLRAFCESKKSSR